MHRWLLAAVGAFGALVAVDTGCHEPTEIIVRVTTSFDCSLLSTSGVGIRVGATAPLTGSTSTISNACKNGYVGSLVLTPSSAYKGQSITVEAIAALAPATLDADGLCAEGSANCIHARRALPYLDGSAITVPITLEASCAGVTCDPSDTCESASCVPASVDPNKCKTDCTLDGGTTTSDGGTTPQNCGDMSGLLANAAMPMDRYCPGHVGWGPYAGPQSAPSQVITIPTGLASGAVQEPPPVVIDDNGDVYFLTIDSNLHAFSCKTGAQKWQPWPTQSSPMTQGVGSLLLGANGTLYVSNDTMVIGVDRNTGAKIGNALTVPDNVRSSLTPGPLGFYFAGPNDAIETVNLSTFAMGPSSPTTTSQIDGCGPTIVGGKAWVGDGLGTAYPFDSTSLTAGPTVSVTKQATLGQFSAAPDGSLRTFFLSGGNGFVAAFDATHVIWTQPAKQASIGDLVAVLRDGTTLYDDDNRNLLAYDSSGKSAQYPGNGHPHFPAVDVNGVVYTLDDPAGHIIAYSSPSNVVWTSAATLATPVWGIYVGTDHNLVVMRTSDVLVFK